MKFLNKKVISLILMSLVIILINALPLLALAANYQLLEPSVIINEQPAGTGEAQPSTYGLKEYLQTAYVVGFTVVLSFIIFWFILGGLEYILSDIPSIKLGGKAKIMSAFFGLAIAMASWLLLNLINPNLLNFSLDLIKS